MDDLAHKGSIYALPAAARDCLVLLYARGALTQDQLYRAYEISAALAALINAKDAARRDAAEVIFEAWSTAAMQRHIPLGPIYAVLCEGLAAGQIDQRFQRRKGWARAMLRSAIDLWPLPTKARHVAPYQNTFKQESVG